MENRNFQLDTEWNVIHYPEKPKGFGILIIGDERHFVDKSNSFWLQNEGKLAIINKLRESGYTIFSSNLYGRNWGSERAVELAQRVYQYVIRNEIINQKIHILAEGMGAIAAIKLMERMSGQIRSMVLLNPILSLRHHLEMEKEHKFFYKRLTKELETAYRMDFKEIEAAAEETKPIEITVPIKIIHVLAGGRSFNHTKLYPLLLKQEAMQQVVNTSFILPEKKPQLGTMIVKYFKIHENIL